MAALTVAAMLLFTALGIWQVERRAWKLDLIARVDARIKGQPEPLPPPASWPAIGPDDAYRRIRVRGTFHHDAETLVQAVTGRGPGYWVVTPLVTASGTVLVNRGFVPPDRRAPSTRAAGAAKDPVTVTGLLRITEPGGGFLRANDPGADRWYSRDVQAIARNRHFGPIAPFFIDADATPNRSGYPVGGLTVVAFPNSHLSYALTWFTLALLSGAATWLVLRPEKEG
ncbi:SURF1 family protein [uncultured Sphingomonas sp.]|uniref:SURF1 family protein n=1 Tax=uncultured Sphingomonas sp. TaxID=158754 RepID=UPI0025E81C66|nr:SURF1 family protein [uncultured Sphingomonas sp.]